MTITIEIVMPDDRDGEPGRVEDRQDARRRHVDLLAHGRRVHDLVVLGGHRYAL